MHLSVNGAVYANGLQLGNRRPGCIRLVKSRIHYREPVKDRLAVLSACLGSTRAVGHVHCQGSSLEISRKILEDDDEPSQQAL